MRTIESRLVPEDGVNVYASHPGFDAEGCPGRITINAATNVTRSGFACTHTGGHCIPNSNKLCFKQIEESGPMVMIQLPDGRLVRDSRF